MIEASGRKRWLLTTKVPLREGDAVTGLVGISHDISQRKLAEEELAEQARLAALSAAVGEALMRWSDVRDMLLPLRRGPGPSRRRGPGASLDVRRGGGPWNYRPSPAWPRPAT